MWKRVLWSALLAALMLPVASAHFVFVIPVKDGTKAVVVFSDELAPDPDVDLAKIASLVLTMKELNGTETALKSTRADHSFEVAVPGTGSRFVSGSVKYGVLAKGGAKPYMLTYHPKAIVGPTVSGLAVGAKLPVELIPTLAGGQVTLKLVGMGKPIANAEVTLIGADGKEKKFQTAADGSTPAFVASGRVGAWARFTIPNAGEHDGKKYDEERHYATLVFDASPTPTRPPLAKGVSSLGAIACDGYVYVYGGHAGKTHTYDKTLVLGTFARLKLDGGTAWESLPGGPIAQGLNLAAHRGKIYRVGGMSPRNAPGEATDNISLTECAVYDPKIGQWSALPALPAGRSSHDLVVAGDQLVVVGGWQMKGKGEKPVWPQTALTLDLANPSAKWVEIPQPFQRRALTASAIGSKVYVLAGLTDEAASVRTVDVLDVATGTWTTGPDLPGTNGIGFSPAATTIADRLVVSTSAGDVFRLSKNGDSWEKVGQSQTKRRVARLVPTGSHEVLLIGGALGGSNATELETITLWY